MLLGSCLTNSCCTKLLFGLLLDGLTLGLRFFGSTLASTGMLFLVFPVRAGFRDKGLRCSCGLALVCSGPLVPSAIVTLLHLRLIVIIMLINVFWLCIFRYIAVYDPFQ
eukprot:TRINITY_DN10222_c0_g1_i6.p2 TRINITY_DN10222_c0_g1~~TRINITY_DN10222_c0_g1_i6.p2  ORF type:complete len:109 (-),score=10.53 TRINITY_DN10222_c0_g1_i6:257-583(-)